MIELQILPQGITKQGELFPRDIFFSKKHAARCGRVFGASSLRRSWKMWLRGELWNRQHEEYQGQNKIATDVFLNATCSVFFCCVMCRSLLSALIQLMWSRRHISGKSQSFVLRPELRQIVCPTTVVREESFTSCRLMDAHLLDENVWIHILPFHDYVGLSWFAGYGSSANLPRGLWGRHERMPTFSWGGRRWNDFHAPTWKIYDRFSKQRVCKFPNSLKSTVFLVTTDLPMAQKTTNIKVFDQKHHRFARLSIQFLIAFPMRTRNDFWCSSRALRSKPQVFISKFCQIFFPLRKRWSPIVQVCVFSYQKQGLYCCCWIVELE